MFANNSRFRKLSSISNPKHSRPIDVHRWSDHPEAIRLAKSIWDEHFTDFDGKESKTGPKPKTSFSNQLKVVILDLYVAWLEDPQLCIGVPMSANGWNSSSRYNALNLTKKITELVRRLHERELLDFAPGSYSGRYAPGNRNTRIRASGKLQQAFSTTSLREQDITHHKNQECIVLKSSDDPADPGHLVDYEDTPATITMRTSLQRYNQLLLRTFIDIPTLDHPNIHTKTPAETSGTLEHPLVIGSSRKFVRRVFNRGAWNLNGRFYGGWWQQVSKEWRSRIFINDEPTVEVDFKGMHAAILGIESGQPIEGDPYELPGNLLPGSPPGLQRNIVKKLILTALNAKNRKSAFSSFREGFPTGHPAKNLTNANLSGLLEAFVTKHPLLEASLCADQGIRLMNVDAQIAQRVINGMTNLGCPVLCIHDSFIVPYSRVRALKGLMSVASRSTLGAALAVEAEGLGLDEMLRDPLYMQQDFINWRQTPRCEGYLGRLADHEGLWGALAAATPSSS